MNGADVLVRQLQARGVEFVATLCGNGLDPLYVSCKKHGLRLVDVRNEQAASYMADCVGRLTRGIGVCAVSSGIAHANAMTGVLNAYFDGAPMLLITGASGNATAGMGNFQDLDQVALAAPACKLAQCVDRPERVALAVHEACSTALSGRPGPVHLTIPGNVLRGAVDEGQGRALLTEEGGGEPARSVPDPDLIREVGELLSRSQRPVLVAGSGLFYADAEESLRNLAAAAGIPVVTPIWDRGSVSRPMPEYLGVVGAASGQPALLPDADLILLVGTHVDYRVGYLRSPTISEKAKVVRIDCDPGELKQGAAPDVALLGHPRRVIEELLKEWQRRHLPARDEWLGEAQQRNRKFRSRWKTLPPRSPMTGHHLVEGLRPVLNDDVIFLVDGGNIGQWAHMLLWDRYPEHWLTCGASAVVGWGLPGAIAAKLCHPDRPVLLLSGDGAIGFTIAEFETAVRHKLPIVVVVADDQAWGIVTSGQRRSLGEPIASILGPIDYVQVAQGFGAQGILVTDPAELAGAVRRAFASGKPTLIEVPIDVGGPAD